MKRLVALIVLVAITIAVGVVAAQALQASPSTSIAPITVERAGPDRIAKEKKDKKGANLKRQDPTPQVSTGGAEPVSPIPIPAGDDDDDDDGTDDSDEVDDDGADDSDDVDDDDGVPD